MLPLVRILELHRVSPRTESPTAGQHGNPDSTPDHISMALPTVVTKVISQLSSMNSPFPLINMDETQITLFMQNSQ